MRREPLPFHDIRHAARGRLQQIVIRQDHVLLFDHPAGRIGLAQQAFMRVRMAVERKANVHEVFDSLEAVALDVRVNAQGVCHGVVDHAAIGIGKAHVVFEEVDVPKDMGGDQQIGNLRIGIEEKGQAGVAVEDNLINLGEPHGAVEMLVLIDLAIGPVARPGGQAIGGHFRHDVLRHHFKGDGEKV